MNKKVVKNATDSNTDLLAFIAKHSPGACKIISSDERSVNLKSVAIEDLILFPYIGKGEQVMVQDRLEPIKKIAILLDAMFCKCLWEHQDEIPVSWRTGDFISFDGTVFENFQGRPFSLAIKWLGDWKETSRDTFREHQIGLRWQLFTTCYQDTIGLPSGCDEKSVILPVATYNHLRDRM